MHVNIQPEGVVRSLNQRNVGIATHNQPHDPSRPVYCLSQRQEPDISEEGARKPTVGGCGIIRPP